MQVTKQVGISTFERAVVGKTRWKESPEFQRDSHSDSQVSPPSRSDVSKVVSAVNCLSAVLVPIRLGVTRSTASGAPAAEIRGPPLEDSSSEWSRTSASMRESQVQPERLCGGADCQRLEEVSPLGEGPPKRAKSGDRKIVVFNHVQARESKQPYGK